MRRCSPRLWLLVAGITFCACRTGRSSAPTRVVTGSPTKRGVTHLVLRGQTLYRIGKTYGVSVADITRANKLGGPEDLAAGMKLWIPGATKVLDVPVMAVSEPEAPKAKPAPEKPKPSPPPAKVAEAETPRTKLGPVKQVVPEKTPRDDDESDEAPAAEAKPAKPAREKSAPPARTSFVWPVKGFVQSPFGQRGNRPHDGIDIKASNGSTIVAVDDGEVIYAGVQRGYGNIVLVKHSEDLITIYAHNETNDVKQGERVTRGQAIATVGHTGRATNDHLHFEVRQNRVPTDPIPFLPEE